MTPALAFEFTLLAALWGASFLFMRIGVVEFGPLPTAATRVVVAALMLLPLMWARGHATQFRQHWRAVCAIGVLNAGVPFALFSFSLLAISTGLSAILNATVPLFGALVAWLWLKDRPGATRTLGLAVGFLGVALLAWPEASFKPNASGIAPAWAVAACLVATLCYGAAANAAKRYLSGLPSLVTAAGSQVGATLALAPLAAWTWPALMPSGRAWLAVIALGVLCTGAAYVLYFRLIEKAGPARAVTVTFVVPVFAIFYGVLFLDEAVTPWMLGCALVIVVGTALSTGIIRFPAASS
jgi:drug/metabolite transporter (DMT)-like permease